MKIVICGSMAFAKQMKDAKAYLKKQGHTVLLPKLVEKFIKIKYLSQRAKKPNVSKDAREIARMKIEHDLIREHYEKIQGADAILVLNYTRNNVKNYIGGNSFLEMGFAYVLGKKIYVLNPLPKIPFYSEEIIAMEPIILNGDLEKIK